MALCLLFNIPCLKGFFCLQAHNKYNIFSTNILSTISLLTLSICKEIKEVLKSVAIIAVYWIEGINLDGSEKFDSYFSFFLVNKSTAVVLKTLCEITMPETTYITHYIVIRLFHELNLICHVRFDLSC